MLSAGLTDSHVIFIFIKSILYYIHRDQTHNSPKNKLLWNSPLLKKRSWDVNLKSVTVWCAQCCAQSNSLCVFMLPTDGRWGGWPEERHAAVGDLRPGDPDVHGTEEQQEAEGPLRAIAPHQIRHPPSAHHGGHQRYGGWTRATSFCFELFKVAFLQDGLFIDLCWAGPSPECGGKMHLREGEFEKAHTDFFEAFKNYDESGSPRRTTCLKYLVLANMLMKSGINPFDSQEVCLRKWSRLLWLQERNNLAMYIISFLVSGWCHKINISLFFCLKAKPYKNDPEILAMTNLVR